MKSFNIIEAQILDINPYFVIEIGKDAVVFENFTFDLNKDFEKDFINIDGQYYDNSSFEVECQLNYQDFMGTKLTTEDENIYISESVAKYLVNYLQSEIESGDLFDMISSDYFNNY